ncbi:hypothetical protein TIFTF001_018526 [Ficus carica]|uniref:BHLH domain-containing protein n=1 Tax=Ficus carica TaxID=3494 RepID=A0AA88A4H1_FICCA|nr:hypothetical protein TIFTF001_018526 [Ficus carica]
MHNSTHSPSSSSMEKRKKKMICKEEKESKLGKKIKQRKQNGEFEAKKENEVRDNISVSDRHEQEPKAGYIHVRARRGQATDSHSLAERARREKIRERLVLLQSLVPGCDRIAGKAQVLDEIIKYVQSLQNLVECLAAKLASVNSMMIDFEVDPLMNRQTPDQAPPSLNNVLESTSFPQFGSFADTTTTTTTTTIPTFASTVVFQDDAELFSGLDHDQSQNIDIPCLENFCNF